MKCVKACHNQINYESKIDNNFIVGNLGAKICRYNQCICKLYFIREENVNAFLPINKNSRVDCTDIFFLFKVHGHVLKIPALLLIADRLITSCKNHEVKRKKH